MLRRLLASVIALVAISLLPASAGAATDASGTSGSVRFVKRMTPEFNRYVENPTPQRVSWMQSKFWRTEVFTPYFDDKVGNYGNGWVYSDLYAIYTGGEIAAQHPEWILRDAAGRKLYIPWGCENGTCPQYAADVTNPEYRAWWIENLAASLAKGYRGAWIDDVNLELRVGDGMGRTVAPMSAALGRTMTAADWRRSIADFTTQIRAAIDPSKEILHNSIWYAALGAGRETNADVRRQIASADYINVEHGFNDGGLTGGRGEWSLFALHRYIDQVHAQGKGVIIDGFDSSAAGMEYALANYMLINTGRDGIGEIHQTPDNWWSGWDTNLGEALGERYEWQGLFRRDFAGGMVLVGEPGAAPRTITLSRPMTTLDGRTVTSVTVGGTSGVVLTGQGERAAPAATASRAAASADDCQRVRVKFQTKRWEPSRGRLVRTKSSAVVCVSAALKPGTAAHRRAVRKARAAAKRDSIRSAKKAKRDALRAQAARAEMVKAAG